MDLHISNTNCPFTIGSSLIKQIFPSIPNVSWDKNGDQCFCLKCNKNGAGNEIIYRAGKPPKRYTLPIGWMKLGLQTDKMKVMMNNVLEEWHVAFHGTAKDVIPQIFKSGLQLLKAGDITMDGDELGIKSGHIQKSFIRYNQYTKEKEKFDPNQIFVTPSIKYASHKAYAPQFKCKHPKDENKWLLVQFVFELRIKPNSYGIGQQTVVSTQNKVVLDQHFSNNELEWYTKQNIGILLCALLLRIKEIDNDYIIDYDNDKKLNVNYSKMIILNSNEKLKEKLLVTGYLRESNFNLPSNIIYLCNVFYGAITKKYDYQFGDITKETMKMVSNVTETATKAVKNYKFGDITRSMFRKLW